MQKILRALIVEDSPRDEALLKRHLLSAGYDLTAWQRVDTPAEMRTALTSSEWDIVLCDYVMPHFDALKALALLRQTGIDIPFIIISGTIGEQVAVEAMLSGAHDYLSKDNLTRLVPAIERELKQANNRRELRATDVAHRISEERYQTLFEYAPDGIITSSPDDYYLDANASMCQMLGYRHDELIGMHASDIVIRSEVRELDSQFALVQTTPDYNNEWHFRRKDGSVFPAEVIATIMPDGNLLAMIRDITDRKAAEQQLQLHSALLNSIGQAVIVTDSAGIITYWNGFAESTYGWPSSEVLGRNIVDVTVTQATRAQGIEILEALKRGESWSGEFIVQDRKGTSFPIFVTNTPLMDAEGKVESIIGISLDVTERKQAEEKLRESESLLSSTQRIAHIGSWVMELSDSRTMETAKEFWSDEHYRIFGFEPGEVEITNELFFNYVHPDDRDQLSEVLRDAIENGQPFAIEHRIILPDGGERTVQAMAEILVDDKTGKPLKLLGSVQDITERKRVEEALRESERAELAAAATQSSILNALPPHIALLDAQGVVLSVNEAWRRFATANVLQGPEFGVGQNYLEVCTSAQGDCAEEAEDAARGIRRVLSGEAEEFTLEYPCHSPAEKRWFRLMVTPLHEDRLSGAVVMHVNITERKLAEEAQRESEERLRLLFDQMKDGFYYSTPDGQLLDVNPAMVEMFGYSSREEMLNVDVTRDLYFSPEERKSQTLDDDKDESGVYRMRRKDGSAIWVEDRGKYKYDEEGKIAFHQGLLRDVTERKTADEKLARSEEQYRDLVENSREMICTHDLEGRLLSLNRAAVEVIGYNPMDDGGGKYLSDILVPEFRDQFPDYLAQIRRDGFADGLMFILTGTGQRRIWEYHNTLRTEGVAVPIVRGMARDITDSKRAEDERQLVFDITQGVLTTPDLAELFKLIHRSIGKLMYAGNCFIGLHDRATDLLHFEYWADKYDPVQPPQPPGKGFANYVLRTNQPLLLT